MRRRLSRLLRVGTWLAGGLCLMCACAKPPVSATDDLPPLGVMAVDPDRLVHSPEKPPDSVAISQIVVAYAGARGASVRNRLSRELARTRAAHLLALARSSGQDFAALSRRFSDDPAGGARGDLGVIMRGQLHPDLERAAFALGSGQVSDVVESPQGFHILMRHEPTEAQAAEIVIAYTGARKYQPRQMRTREQALALASELRHRAVAGADFSELAVRHSDLSNWPQGGFSPIFQRGKRPSQFEKIFWPLAEGEISQVVETQTGFHVVKRFPVRRIAVRMIALGFRPEVDTDRQPGDAGRTRADALLLMRQLREQATQPGGDFAALAAGNSEHASKDRGGWLGWIGRGEFSHTIDRAAFSLEPGAISGVLTDASNLYLLKRIR